VENEYEGVMKEMEMLKQRLIGIEKEKNSLRNNNRDNTIINSPEYHENQVKSYRHARIFDPKFLPNTVDNLALTLPKLCVVIECYAFYDSDGCDYAIFYVDNKKLLLESKSNLFPISMNNFKSFNVNKPFYIRFFANSRNDSIIIPSSFRVYQFDQDEKDDNDDKNVIDMIIQPAAQKLFRLLSSITKGGRPLVEHIKIFRFESIADLHQKSLDNKPLFLKCVGSSDTLHYIYYSCKLSYGGSNNNNNKNNDIHKDKITISRHTSNFTDIKATTYHRCDWEKVVTFNQ
jgi:hypothetical protein